MDFDKIYKMSEQEEFRTMKEIFLKNYEEVSIAMSVLNHLMRNDSSVVTYSDFCNQIRKVIEA